MKYRAPPTALMCSTDMFATGTLLEARRPGLDVPGDPPSSGSRRTN
ncbi:MAG: hypothetical protein RI571_06130 [Roseovarius sp.]|nr:hypothetical protein [Roseovarius sp.]